MKKLITLFIAIALITGIYSCGKEDSPPEESGSSSYEFKFLSGPLEGKEYRASGLSREQVTSLFTEQPSENLKGIFTQLLNGNMTVVATIGLTANNQVQPFNDDDTSVGTQMFLSFTDNGVNYVYGAKSGTPTIKNLKIATVGSSGGASMGLTTYELSFSNATFYDEVASGNGQNVEVKVSGKIIIQ
ncbi:hypothetical protein FAZ19_15310 [Sphingobacterium alkalisoli]|uniref:Lipoprotein n=1 Tax=Sphingobacterium alkalisoli TaxID=1874115 RepID=A0A4V6WF45_9SPHI|nr:hypothetical protein [Sphingobacterium alkalisoli]TJY64559.1 hypothetical protein FAZ19_15310 [Sphingobacterium alkalisoli]GGH20981.1 hypothetical protein GCM10011418_26570 [Sphingobacterium alkalisoli]